MPTHVTHRLFVTAGDPKALRRFIGEDECGDPQIDFNRLIPMPESLDIEEGSRGKKGRAALFGNWQNVLVFDENWARVEFDSREALIAHFREHDPQALELGRTYQENLVTHGARTWYDWRGDRWGTKWSAYSLKVVEPDFSELVFDTSWSVPKPIFHALAEALPEHRIRIYSFNEGWDFCAETIIRNGKAEVCVMDPSTAIFEKVYGADW